MVVKQHQEFMTAGSRFYFREDAIASVEQFWRDMGTIIVANPQTTAEPIELKDPFGGVEKTVWTAITNYQEAYDIQTRNLGLENLSMQLQATAPETWSQTAAEKTVDHYVHPGRLVAIHDSDTAATTLHALDAVAGIYTGAVVTAVLTDISATARTFTISSDITTELIVGESFIVHKAGLTNIKNSRSYVVSAISFGGGNTTITTTDVVTAAESSIVGQITYATTGSGGVVYKQGTDWEDYELDTGFVRIIPGGAITLAATKKIIFSTGTVASGLRLAKPQKRSGLFTGDAQIWWKRDGHTRGTVRKARVSIAPSASSIAEEGSDSTFTFAVKVLSDVTQDTDQDPAGSLLQPLGTVPTTS